MDAVAYPDPMSLRVRAILASSLVTAFALSALVTACDDTRPPASGGTGSGGDSGPDLRVDGSASEASAEASSEAGTDADGGELACNMLEADGPLVPEAAAGGAQPAATGGQIFPGTYWLTERVTYGGAPDGLFVKRALLVSAKTIDVIEGSTTSANAAPLLTTSSATYEVLDTFVLSKEVTCPAPPHSMSTRFTANGAQLTLFPTNDTSELYTLQ
jgi:hypothetical protein